MDGRKRKQRRRAGRKIAALRYGCAICLLAAVAVFFVARGDTDKEESGRESPLTEEERNGKDPLFLQTDERWGHMPYGQSTISEAGCAPTCLAMAVVALTGKRDITPQQVASYSERCGYYAEGKGTRWALFSEGCSAYGLSAAELPLSEKRMAEALDDGGKIVCAMGPGDFTTEGHFIELYGYERERGFYVHDPNSLARSRKLWKYSELQGQIRNLWALYAADR